VIAVFWSLKNGTWFVYNGQTFLKLYGGPKAAVYCPQTKRILVFKHQSAAVAVTS